MANHGWRGHLPARSGHSIIFDPIRGLRAAVSLLSILLLWPATALAQSALQTAADALAPGSWVNFSINNLSLLLTPNHASLPCGTQGNGTSGNAVGYASKGLWDPIGRKWYFYGSDHACSNAFFVYDETTNALSLLPTVPGSFITNHQYDMWAIDVRGRRIYRKHFGGGTNNIYSYNLTTGTWSQLPSVPAGVLNSGSETYALNFHPELGNAGWLVMAAADSCGAGCVGRIIRYDPLTNDWARIDNFQGSMGDLHQISAYSDIHKVLVFGVGDSASPSLAVWRLDSFSFPNYGTGEIVTQTSSPVTLSTGTSGARITADPVTGNFIVTNGLNSWYEFDPTQGASGTWTQKTGQASLFTSPNSCGGGNNCHIGIPISTHGVIMYVICSPSACNAWLYKNAAFSAADRDFRQRCWQPGVMRCVGFDSSVDTQGILGDRTALSNGTRTNTQKASGSHAISFTISPGNSGSSTQWYYANFRDTADKKFAEGGEFWVQYRIRFDSNYVSGPTGFKQGMTGAGDKPAASRSNTLNIDSGGPFATSCTQLEIVWQRVTGRSMFGAYHACPGTRVGDVGSVRPFDSRQCAGSDNPEVGCQSGSDFQRQHVANCTSQGGTTGCEPFRANEWLTQKLRVRIGTWYVNNQVYRHDSIVQKWVGREGQALRRVFDARQQGNASCDNSSSDDPPCKTGVDLANTNQGDLQYGKTWLLPYSGGDPFPNGGTVYYDELIISTQDIPDPGVASSDPGPPPSAPTGLRLSWLTTPVLLFVSFLHSSSVLRMLKRLVSR